MVYAVQMLSLCTTLQPKHASLHTSYLHGEGAATLLRMNTCIWGSA